MKMIEASIRYPVSTAVGVILLILFGAIALFRIPIQLTPNVEEPKVTITTLWPGASPQEIEQEIIEEQEEQLKSVEGMLKMESSSADSVGTITITFPAGAELDQALLKVSNRLDQVPSYPEDADKPIITTVDVNESAIAWLILVGEDGKYEGDISTLYDFVDDFIKPEIERVPGVGGSNIFGGREHEMQVIVDPAKIAAREVTINQLAAALERENRNYSGGDFEEGKRRYVVRTVGEYGSTEDIENIVVAVKNGIPVYVRDVARAELGFQKRTADVFNFGKRVLALNAIRQTGANVLDVMDRLHETVAVLNRDLLQPRGLRLVQVYDETDYIRSAISLVQQSLVVGGLLAIAVLLLYLRSGSSTLIIAVAIPISIVGTFLMMLWFGRTLNVVSLAGLAFAVGMVVDNSIVVLENIYRHRQMGHSRFDAANRGASEVWGAVLASTLTTIAVFLPVFFIAGEVGQLFGDIAIAISCAVALSLIISITVIPSLSAKILGGAKAGKTRKRPPVSVRLGQGFTEGVTASVAWINRSWTRRVALIVVMMATSIGLGWKLVPDTEYLPVGNQNFLFGLIIPPPGYNVDEVSKLADHFDALKPLWESEPGSAEARKQPGGGIENFFFVSLADRAFMGFRSRDPLRVRELIPVIEEASNGMPGSLVVISQSSIFQRGIDEGRNIDIDLTGPDLDRLLALGGEVFGRVLQVLPTAQARPIPSLDLGNPEIRVVTNRRRAADLGISNRDLGFTVSALVDGAKASDYRYQGKEIDLRIKGDGLADLRTHLLGQIPIAAPGGQLVTLGSVADISAVNGPTQINHRERQRVITIRLTPDETTPLEAALRKIEGEIIEPMTQQGRLGGLYQSFMSGSADKLTETGQAIKWNLLLALVITYLLMAALFESFLYPFVIMFSVPLAGLGGVLGLAALNQFSYQALDVLTMLGFIILIGTVVNNAILIVHQSLNHMREEGMEPNAAITESVHNRIRPIFMSVSTSVFGMLPLVLFPGAGSELYRGLGSVVVGGLVLSTIFTLFLVPAMLSLTFDLRQAITGRLGVASPEPQTEPS